MHYASSSTHPAGIDMAITPISDATTTLCLDLGSTATPNGQGALTLSLTMPAAPMNSDMPPKERSISLQLCAIAIRQQALVGCISDLSPFFAPATDGPDHPPSSRGTGAEKFDSGIAGPQHLSPTSMHSSDQKRLATTQPTPWRMFGSIRSCRLELPPQREQPKDLAVDHSHATGRENRTQPIAYALVHSLHVLYGPKDQPRPDLHSSQASTSDPEWAAADPSTPGSSLEIVFHSAELILATGSSTGAPRKASSTRVSTPSVSGVSKVGGAQDGSASCVSACTSAVAGLAMAVHDSHFPECSKTGNCASDNGPENKHETATGVSPEEQLLAERSRLISRGYEPAAFLSRLGMQWEWHEPAVTGAEMRAPSGPHTTYATGKAFNASSNLQPPSQSTDDKPAAWQMTVTNDDATVHTSPMGAFALMQLFQKMQDADNEAPERASSGSLEGTSTTSLDQPLGTSSRMDTTQPGVRTTCGQQGITIIESYDPSDRGSSSTLQSNAALQPDNCSPLRSTLGMQAGAGSVTTLHRTLDATDEPDSPTSYNVDSLADSSPPAEPAARWLYDVPVEVKDDHIERAGMISHYAQQGMASPPSSPCRERVILSDLKIRWALHEQPDGWATEVYRGAQGESTDVEISCTRSRLPFPSAPYPPFSFFHRNDRDGTRGRCCFGSGVRGCSCCCGTGCRWAQLEVD